MQLLQFLCTFADGFGVLIAAVGVLGAIVVFRRDQSTKAADLLLRLEERFHEVHPTLIELEYQQDFEQKYQRALTKVLASPPLPLSRVESEVLDQLEYALRHLFTCQQLRRFWVNRRTMDSLYAYYLRILAERQDTREYLRRFWPRLLSWAELSRASPLGGLAIRVRDRLHRFTRWLRGKRATEVITERSRFPAYPPSGRRVRFAAMHKSMRWSPRVRAGSAFALTTRSPSVGGRTTRNPLPNEAPR